jgi:hypothetical protein
MRNPNYVGGTVCKGGPGTAWAVDKSLAPGAHSITTIWGSNNTPCQVEIQYNSYNETWDFDHFVAKIADYSVFNLPWDCKPSPSQ